MTAIIQYFWGFEALWAPPCFFDEDNANSFLTAATNGSGTSAAQNKAWMQSGLVFTLVADLIQICPA